VCLVVQQHVRPRGDVKSNPITDLDRSWGFQEAEASRFQDNRHTKVLRLSALHTGRLYSPGNIPGTHFCLELSQPQGHSAARRIMSMKNSNVTVGNRTHNLPACNTVPQPTALPRAPCRRDAFTRMLYNVNKFELFDNNWQTQWYDLCLKR
jgi:hypothetical protein